MRGTEMKASMKTILTVALALSASSPALAQQPDWSQPGDYYAPENATVPQLTRRQRYLFQHGDYYAADRTIMQRPTPRQLYLFRHGDYYAPGRY
jgi:hypothetical protein